MKRHDRAAKMDKINNSLPNMAPDGPLGTQNKGTSLPFPVTITPILTPPRSQAC